MKSNYVPNFANKDSRTENVFCFRTACFDFVQVILENLPSQACKTMIKIIFKGRCVSKLHIKASNCSVIPLKPKMFDGSVLLSYFNGIFCNQADFCSALFRHPHFNPKFASTSNKVYAP